MPMQVRGVVDSNVNTSAFSVANRDGITYVAGDLVLLVKQSTPAQNGVWYVDAPSGGVANLERTSGWSSGATIRRGDAVDVGFEGTLYGGTRWRVTSSGNVVVDTDDPALYPEKCLARVTLASGQYTMGSAEGLWLLSAAGSRVSATRVAGSGTTLTLEYAAPSASRTAGPVGTGAVLLRAEVAGGTVNVLDASVVDVTVHNC